MSQFHIHVYLALWALWNFWRFVEALGCSDDQITNTGNLWLHFSYQMAAACVCLETQLGAADHKHTAPLFLRHGGEWRLWRGIHHSSSGWPHLEMMTRGWNNNLIIILPRHHKETLNIVSDSDSSIKGFKTLQQDTCLIKSSNRHPDPHYLLSRTLVVTRTGHKKSCRWPPSSHLAMPPRSGLHDNLYPCINSKYLLLEPPPALKICYQLIFWFLQPGVCLNFNKVCLYK